MPASTWTAARHRARATTPPWRLVLRFAARARWEYLLRFPSNYSWMVLRRKYDAFTTDRAYEDRPASWLGPLGEWADRRVLDFPVHVALRQRLEHVAVALADGVERRWRMRGRPVRVLSAPGGLARDLTVAASRLSAAGIEPARAMELHCLDLDVAGDVIPEARRRLEEAGLRATFYREDLLHSTSLPALAESGARFDIINCIGLTAWLDFAEVDGLFALFRSVLADDGTLLVDNWARHPHSAAGDDLEIDTRYHAPQDFASLLERNGLRVRGELRSANGVVTLYSASAS
jgi:hypothetical protein